MTRNKYALVSTVDKEGNIQHKASGRVNINASTWKPNMRSAEEFGGQRITDLEEIHEDYLRRNDAEMIETFVIGPRIGQTLLQRVVAGYEIMMES